MSNLIDLTNQKFGRLTVIKRAPNTKATNAMWLCKCDCGNETIVKGSHLKDGNVKSCGCLRGIENKSRAKHGLAGSKIYNVWRNMLKRCYLPNNANYKYYGARGIKVCEEWKNRKNGFTNFLKWAIANGYKEGLLIDRINVNGNYEPANCRWVTSRISANNKRNNQLLTIEGETKTLSEWAREKNISFSCLWDRLKRNIPPDRLFEKNLRRCSSSHEKS